MRIIGMDFGTSTTYLSQAQRLLSTHLVVGRNGYIPSVAKLDAQRGILVGDQVELDDPDAIRSIKSRITNLAKDPDWDAPISDSTKSIQAKPSEIIERLIGVATSEAALLQDPDTRVRLGCPSSWNGQQRLKLLERAWSVGLPVAPTDLIDEPVAAVSAWFFSARQAKLLPRRTREPETLRVALLDMGGGTLDIALVDVRNYLSPSPELRVLASLGNAIAGDSFDRELARVLRSKLGAADSELIDAADRLPNSFLAACKALKHSLGDKPKHSEMKFVGAQRYRMTISQIDAEEAFTPLFSETWAMLLQTLREAKTAESVRPLTNLHLESVSVSELLESLDVVVLAGGMAHLHVFKQMLLGKLGEFDEEIAVFDAEDEMANYSVDEAVSLGLGLGQELQRVNYHRPQFSIYLELEDRDGSRVTIDEPVYEAFASLQQFSARRSGFTTISHKWRFIEHVPERFLGARAWLVAKSLDGSQRPFKQIDDFPTSQEDSAKQLDASKIEFTIRPANDTSWGNDLIQIQASGRILIRSGPHKIEIRIPEWPADRRENSVLYEVVDPRLVGGDESRSALRRIR